MWIAVLIAFLFAGCAATVLPSERAVSPAHPIAEAGIGITVWKFPVVGLGLWGVGGGAPAYQAIVYQYNYQAVPKHTIGGIPTEPPGPPAPVVRPQERKSSEKPAAVVPLPVEMRTVYPLSPWDDPTLVIFQNASDHKTFRISIDGKSDVPEHVLEPRRISPNIYLPVGAYQIRVRGSVPTAQFGAISIPERLLPLRIEPEGRWQLIVLH